MTKSERKEWTREELVLAINLYCKTPFGKIHTKNPDIILLAKTLNRTPGSISYKLANFASIDPSLPRKGATHVSKLDQEVWNDFFENLGDMVYDSERLSCEARGTTIEEEIFTTRLGKTKSANVKTRVNQWFFRKMVLATYENTCCLTGLGVESLLVASHIVPWSKDKNNRLNPRNGLCLNALHDKAFDVGLITLDEQYRVVISPSIRDLDSNKKEQLERIRNKRIVIPKRFIPDQKLLSYHREQVFVSQ